MKNLLIFLFALLMSCVGKEEFNIDFSKEYIFVNENSFEMIEKIKHNKIIFNSDGTYSREEDARQIEYVNNKKSRYSVMVTDMRGRWDNINNEVYLTDEEVIEFYCVNSHGEKFDCEFDKSEIMFGSSEFFKNASTCFLDNNIVLYKVDR